MHLSEKNCMKLTVVGAVYEIIFLFVLIDASNQNIKVLQHLSPPHFFFLSFSSLSLSVYIYIYNSRLPMFIKGMILITLILSSSTAYTQTQFNLVNSNMEIASAKQLFRFRFALSECIYFGRVFNKNRHFNNNNHNKMNRITNAINKTKDKSVFFLSLVFPPKYFRWRIEHKYRK